MKKTIQYLLSILLSGVVFFSCLLPLLSKERGVVDMTRKSPVTADALYGFYIILAAVMLVFIICIFVFWSIRKRQTGGKDDDLSK